MRNKPLYITSFNGSIIKTNLLNGTYTEIDVPAKGTYIIFFEGFSQKIVIKQQNKTQATGMDFIQ